MKIHPGILYFGPFFHGDDEEKMMSRIIVRSTFAKTPSHQHSHRRRSFDKVLGANLQQKK